MPRRLTALLGITSPLFAITLGVTAPQAAAAPTVVLAPWVSCTEFWCRNETDDTYRVDVIVDCGFGMERVTRAHLPARRTTSVNGGCGSRSEPCSDGGKSLSSCSRPNLIFGIRYDNVVVDNSPIPPWPFGGTGSSF
ncbi:hypothetical protein [Nocardia sp. NPDC051832]|uniref:hypothetical protein n=1 Tax=Nocardia sp. NPDC051832 TaxID=3155673 RepID=UPI0034302523